MSEPPRAPLPAAAAPPPGPATLRRTWLPFFGRFGRLTAIQQATIPRVLAGANVIVAAPTGAGKTEAVLAPLCERWLGPMAGSGAARLVYVVPTRALVNDLERRIAGPLGAAGVTLGVRTGDRPRVRAGSPNVDVVLTTPESLDVLLAGQEARFQGLRAVVLDELHLIDGTVRGDQLRVLTRRLVRLAGELQFAALSATFADPEAVAARYFEHPQAVAAGTPRRLMLNLVESLAEAVAALRAERRHKAILFCNRRADTEEVALQLARDGLWPRERLFVHHGSLARRQREDVERALREQRWGLVVATSTLEVGIDIGDLDAVLLYGPPPTATAFQQRTGRACRREPAIRALGIVRDPGDAEIFGVFAALAEEGVVEPRPYEPDASVAVQQLFVLLSAEPQGLPEAELEALVEPLLPPGGFALLAAHLVERDFVARRRGVLAPSPRLLDLAETGRIYSNLAAAREVRVVEAGSGRLIGVATVVVEPGAVFAFAGRVWLVVSGGPTEVRVTAVPGAAASLRFLRREARGAFTRYLPDALQPAPPAAGDRHA